MLASSCFFYSLLFLPYHPAWMQRKQGNEISTPGVSYPKTADPNARRPLETVRISVDNRMGAVYIRTDPAIARSWISPGPAGRWRRHITGYVVPK